MEDGELVGLRMSSFVGQLTERVRTYEGVRNRAEVWFNRVRCQLGGQMVHGSLTSIMLGVSELMFLSSCILGVKPVFKMLSNSHTTDSLPFPRDACLCPFLSLPMNPVRIYLTPRRLAEPSPWLFSQSVPGCWRGHSCHISTRTFSPRLLCRLALRIHMYT